MRPHTQIALSLGVGVAVLIISLMTKPQPQAPSDTWTIVPGSMATLNPGADPILGTPAIGFAHKDECVRVAQSAYTGPVACVSDAFEAAPAAPVGAVLARIISADAMILDQALPNAEACADAAEAQSIKNPNAAYHCINVAP